VILGFNRPQVFLDFIGISQDEWLPFGHDHYYGHTGVPVKPRALISVYNGDNELTSRRFSGGPNGAQLRADISYNADGEMTLLKRYADTAGTQFLGQTQYTNDPIGNVTEIKHTNSSGTVLEDFTYSLDAGSRLTSETDTINGTPTTTNDGYDSSNQLTSSGGKTYNWDLEGNPTNSGEQVGPDNQLITDGNWNYKYDPEGNVIEKDGAAGGPDAGLVWKYGYDNENHLTNAVETNASNQVLVQDSFFYDVNNNRVESDVTINGTTTVTKYAYDQNGQVWADLNSTNGIITRRQYLDTVDSLFARIGSDGTEAWYLTDHLGSVRGLMNNSGSLIDSLSYDAFGNITNESSPSNGDRYKYTAREWNAELNLQYNRARFYDPSTGRWMSQDPLGFDAGDSNLYRYTKNSPAVNTDASGLIPPNWVPVAPAGPYFWFFQHQQRFGAPRGVGKGSLQILPNGARSYLKITAAPKGTTGSCNTTVGFIDAPGSPFGKFDAGGALVLSMAAFSPGKYTVNLQLSVVLIRAFSSGSVVGKFVDVNDKTVLSSRVVLPAKSQFDSEKRSISLVIPKGRTGSYVVAFIPTIATSGKTGYGAALGTIRAYPNNR
jgi:RHS repeat-associated protein